MGIILRLYFLLALSWSPSCVLEETPCGRTFKEQSEVCVPEGLDAHTEDESDAKIDALVLPTHPED